MAQVGVMQAVPEGWLEHGTTQQRDAPDGPRVWLAPDGGSPFGEPTLPRGSRRKEARPAGDLGVRQANGNGRRQQASGRSFRLSLRGMT